MGNEENFHAYYECKNCGNKYEVINHSPGMERECKKCNVKNKPYTEVRSKIALNLYMILIFK